MPYFYMKCDSSGGICTEGAIRKYRQYNVLNTILQLMLRQSAGSSWLYVVSIFTRGPEDGVMKNGIFSVLLGRRTTIHRSVPVYSCFCFFLGDTKTKEWL